MPGEIISLSRYKLIKEAAYEERVISFVPSLVHFVGNLKLLLLDGSSQRRHAQTWNWDSPAYARCRAFSLPTGALSPPTASLLSKPATPSMFLLRFSQEDSSRLMRETESLSRTLQGRSNLHWPWLKSVGRSGATATAACSASEWHVHGQRVQAFRRQ